jgi:hypothetical protein
MGATLPMGLAKEREPLTAGSFHIWESPMSHSFGPLVLLVAFRYSSMAWKVCSLNSNLPGRMDREERYLIVACTVITDVPEPAGPLPAALIAKVSLPLYRALAVYS